MSAATADHIAKPVKAFDRYPTWVLRWAVEKGNSTTASQLSQLKRISDIPVLWRCHPRMRRSD